MASILSSRRSYELPISREYVRHWSMPEAVREIIQNALDSESPFEYEFKSDKLFIRSRDAVLSTSTFAQLKQILDGLDRCHARDSKAEFLRVWIRDWAQHKIEQATRPAPGVPEGFALVPVEPTPEMMEAMPSLPAIGAPGDMKLKAKGWSLKAIQNRHRWLAALAAAQAKGAQA